MIQVRELILGEGIPAICVPLTGDTEVELIRQGEQALRAGADLVEWRADYLRDGIHSLLPLAGKLRSAMGEKLPILFTIRTIPEGGQADCSEEQYCQLNLMMAESGLIDLVDVEAFSGTGDRRELIQKLQQAGCAVVASSHDFQRTPSEGELLRRYQQMDETGADILKLAVMPRSEADVDKLIGAVEKMHRRTDKPLIGIAMGELGRRTRVEGEAFGSCLTFGVVDASSAPGQLEIGILKKELAECHRRLLRQRA